MLAAKQLPLHRLPIAPAPVVPKRAVKPRQRHNLRRIAALVVLFSVLAFVAVAREAAVVGRERSLLRLQSEIASLEAANALLRVEVARQGSHTNIERIARERLGMIAPTAQQIITLASGGNRN